MYACTELDASNQCVQWVQIIYGLPPLTQEQVYQLGGSFVLLYATAFGLGLIVRMILNSGANRFQ